MMTKQMYILCLLWLPQWALAQSSFDMRTVRWGMSKLQVLKAETGNKPNHNTAQYLQYSTKTGKYPAGLTYRFNGNELVRATYMLAQEHSEPQLYIDDLTDIAAILTKKYGEPSVNYEWKNPMFKEQPGKWGLAVASGHLAISYVWQTPRTVIGMLMNGDNYTIHQHIHYLSKLHPQQADESTEAGF